MRIALLSASKRLEDGSLRADQALAGRSALAWQIDLALCVGCERIICLCEHPGPEVIAQQKRIEADGLDFHAVRSHTQLSGLVRDADDVLVVLDGLIIAPRFAQTELGDEGALARGIWTFEAGQALALVHPEDFERIDRERHWAGLAVLTGKQIGQLRDWPADGETVSLLLRIGLQSRLECRAVDAEYFEHDRWLLASDPDALARRSASIVDASVPKVPWSGPANALATRCAQAVGSRGTRWGPEIAYAASALLLTVGAIVAGLGYGSIGLGLAAFGSFSSALGKSLARMRAAIASDLSRPHVERAALLVAFGMATLVVILAYDTAGGPWVEVSVPVLAMGLAWLAGQAGLDRLAAFWRDTPTHLAGFAIAATVGWLEPAVIVFALGALMQLVLRTLKQ